MATQVGNMYTPSLYGGLVSLIAESTLESLSGSRIGMFSYGSGLAATMFSLKGSSDKGPDSTLAKLIVSQADLHSRLKARIEIQPDVFAQTMKLKEETHHKAPYSPVGDPKALFPGTWYLTHVDDMYRRKYECLSYSNTTHPAKAVATATTKEASISQSNASDSLPKLPQPVL